MLPEAIAMLTGMKPELPPKHWGHYAPFINGVTIPKPAL